MDKDLRKLAKELQRQGFEVHYTKRGHALVKREGRTVAVISGTPSDWRAMKNAIAHLRRAGFVWKR